MWLSLRSTPCRTVAENLIDLGLTGSVRIAAVEEDTNTAIPRATTKDTLVATRHVTKMCRRQRQHRYNREGNGARLATTMTVG